MKLSFSKMQGAGNDFVVIDAVTQAVNLSVAHIKRIADRRRGIGCDQVLLLSPPDDPDADFRYSIFNADGSRAGQCGNGARCVGRFLREKKLTRQRELTLLTDGEPLSLSITEDGRVFCLPGGAQVRSGIGAFFRRRDGRAISAGGAGPASLGRGFVYGESHAILMVDDCDSAPVGSLGPLIESHERFPDRVNVGFLQVNSRTDAKLRVYERGVGETEACGSGGLRCRSARHATGIAGFGCHPAIAGRQADCLMGGRQQPGLAGWTHCVRV